MRLLRAGITISGVAVLGLSSYGLSAFGAAADPLQATMNRLDEAAAGFRGLSADVHKIAHTAVINEDTVDEGAILVKRPKPRDMRMLVDIKKPDPKTVAVAGRKVEIYFPKMNTVQEYDAGKNRALLDQFFLLGFGSTSADLKSGYEVKLGGPETVAGQKTTRIELVPKSKEVLAHLTGVELWISDSAGLTVQQKFHMPGGDYTQATYTNIKINPNLPDTALKLNLPKGVKRETPQK
jgi:outer membrane lipoprotein-sorting protein